MLIRLTFSIFRVHKKQLVMEKIQSTVLPPEQPSYTEWYREFSIGILAPKPRDGKDRANEMMNLWKDKNDNIDFTLTIKRLEP